MALSVLVQDTVTAMMQDTVINWKPLCWSRDADSRKASPYRRAFNSKSSSRIYKGCRAIPPLRAVSLSSPQGQCEWHFFPRQLHHCCRNMVHRDHYMAFYIMASPTNGLFSFQIGILINSSLLHFLTSHTSVESATVQNEPKGTRLKNTRASRGQIRV